MKSGKKVNAKESMVEVENEQEDDKMEAILAQLDQSSDQEVLASLKNMSDDDFMKLSRSIAQELEIIQRGLKGKSSTSPAPQSSRGSPNAPTKSKSRK